MELVIFDFDLEHSNGCTKDYVTFSGSSDRYCGISLAGKRSTRLRTILYILSPVDKVKFSTQRIIFFLYFSIFRHLTWPESCHVFRDRQLRFQTRLQCRFFANSLSRIGQSITKRTELLIILLKSIHRRDNNPFLFVACNFDEHESITCNNFRRFEK